MIYFSIAKQEFTIIDLITNLYVNLGLKPRIIIQESWL